MVEDTPDDRIHDLFEEHLWKGHPLGFPILGTESRVEGFCRDDLIRFFRSRYRGKSLVITAAGHLRHEDLVGLARKSFRSLAARASGGRTRAPEARTGRALVGKDLEQVHLIVGTPAPSALSPDRHAGFILNAVLGGSMSSWLFQEIREKRGLAYSIYSYLTPYMDAGLMGIYVGTGRDQVREVLGLVRNGMERFASRLLTPRELQSAKELIKGNYLLGMESTDNRMTGLARNELCFGRHVPPEEVLERIDAVDRQSVRTLAGRLFQPETQMVAAIGPVSEEDLA